MSRFQLKLKIMCLKNLKILTLNFVDFLDLVGYGWEMRAWDRQFTSRRDSLRSRQVAISRSSHRESSSRQSLLNLFELVQVSLYEPAKSRIKQVKKIELNFFTFYAVWLHVQAGNRVRRL